MICRNCGKDVSFIGKVCPYCHASKEEAKNFQMSFYLIAFSGGFIGAFIGFLLAAAKGTSGKMIPMAIGFMIAAAISGITYSIIHTVKKVKSDIKEKQGEK